MKTIIFIFLLSTVLQSCKSPNDKRCKNRVQISFTNRTQKSLLVVNGITLAVDSNDTQREILCFDDVEKSDGNFRFHLKNKKLDTVIAWGYYSNGIPSDNHIKILLIKDSVAISTN